MAMIRHIPAGLKRDLGAHGVRPSDVVMYINSACNLRCRHCYIGNDLLDTGVRYPGAEILEFVEALGTIERLTIVGGEPLLHPDINLLLSRLPYSSIGLVRLTTNLTTLKRVNYHDSAFARVTLCISLDGHNAEIHDEIRGIGAFDATVANLRKVLAAGCNVEITHTISSHNIHHFDSFLTLCRQLGVRLLNLHRISLQGNALENRNLSVSATDWVNFRERLEMGFAAGGGLYGIRVRYPVLFATHSQLEDLLRDGQYHHHVEGSFYAQGDRLVLYPDGHLYISSEAFGTECYIGDISEGSFRWNEGPTNEIAVFRSENASIRLINVLQSGDAKYPVVLSVSYKRQGFL